MDVDLSTWDFWWEFNKDSFLHLKRAVHGGGTVTGSDEFYLGRGLRFDARDTQAPTRTQIVGEVLPALARALDQTDNRDITTACMIAMAKIGEDHPEFALVDVFKKRLPRGDQEVRETAALALGIAAVVHHGEVELLTALARDDAEGRKAAGGFVGDRTRAFALYGLGLLAHEHRDLALQEQVLATLRAVLGDGAIAGRDLKVAAINSMSLLSLDRTNPRGAALLAQATGALGDYFTRSVGSGEQLIQAHCPTAIAKLIGRDHPDSRRWQERFAAELHQPRRDRQSADLQRSCVL